MIWFVLALWILSSLMMGLAMIVKPLGPSRSSDIFEVQRRSF